MGVASNGCSPLTKYCLVYLEEVSYIKAQIIHTADPVAQLHVSVAGDLVCCKVGTYSTFIGIMELPPLQLAIYGDFLFVHTRQGTLNLEGRIQECWCSNLKLEAFCIAEIYCVEAKMLRNYSLSLLPPSITSNKNISKN